MDGSDGKKLALDISEKEKKYLKLSS